jgi:hypothetical protein
MAAVFSTVRDLSSGDDIGYFPQVLIDLVVVGHVELDLETHFGLERLQHGEVPFSSKEAPFCDMSVARL